MIRRLIILLLIVGCEEPSQHGCLDSQACNYDSDATADDGSCIAPQGCNNWCEPYLEEIVEDSDELPQNDGALELDCADGCL